MSYACRDARMPDLERLVELLAEDVLGKAREDLSSPLPEPYSVALQEIIEADFTRIIVVEADGVVAGALQMTLIPHLSYVGQRRAIFESVHVAASERGKGAGAFLVEHAIGEARKARCGQIVLTSSNSRLNAHRFWARMGFEASHVGMKLHLA